MELAKILAEIDLPKGVVNVIPGFGPDCGEELATNPMVDKVAFTGSTAVGRRIMQLASGTVKKVTLELGGKSPAILCDDADLDLAAAGILFGVFFHQGQACESGTRLFVSERIQTSLSTAREARETLRVGDPGSIERRRSLIAGAARARGGTSGAVWKARRSDRRRRPADCEGYVEPAIHGREERDEDRPEDLRAGALRVQDIDDAVRMDETIYGWAPLGRGTRTRPSPSPGGCRGTVWINEHHMLGRRPSADKQSGIGGSSAPTACQYLRVKHVRSGRRASASSVASHLGEGL
jgi:aldehyde dehydrogenase (NAD+)